VTASPSDAVVWGEGERILGFSSNAVVRCDVVSVAGVREDGTGGLVTNDKNFKRLVRERMQATGDSYTTARAALRESPAGAGAGASRDAHIFVTGHRGLVGSAIVRQLRARGHRNILTAGREQLDLRDQAAVNYWFRANRPELVYLVAGTVGGVLANATRPAEFIYDNLMIHGTVVHASHEYRVRKLLYLGSSCVYPRDAAQPITEDALLTGPLEPTNEAYALAKLAGMKLCESYREQYGDTFVSAMPTNLYGPNDNFDDIGGHLVPMLIRRFHEAKERGDREVVVWGSGEPYRELMHVDDLAEACVFLMDRYDGPGFVNVGTGRDHRIRTIAALVREVVHPTAELRFDRTKPDGMPRKVLDVSRIHALGWHHRIDLADGLRATYEWFLAHRDEARGVARTTPAA
jgi:GDP-L-fucose synthase